MKWQGRLRNLKKYIDDHKRSVLIGLSLLLFLIACALYLVNLNLLRRYESLESVVVKDRHGEIISISPNAKGQYAEYGTELPDRARKLLIKKEDRFFYFHVGINPISIARAVGRYIVRGAAGGSSTITQQLVKNLYHNENNRSFTNKLKELVGTLALEVFQSKRKVLLMYANTAYMGNEIQGLSGGSRAYFGKELSELHDSELSMLLATLSSPTLTNPWKQANVTNATILAKRLGVDFSPTDTHVISKSESRSAGIVTDTSFELFSLSTCERACTTTLDKKLTDSLRTILSRTIQNGKDLGMTTGAIVVIKEPEHQLLAIVGSPVAGGLESGHAINMAIEPRPIGSTAKPFIYLSAFEKGLRPYTLVDDRENKFEIGTGMPFYPKNYDGQYRGEVTLHYALSNSLNIPSVKTLQFVTLPDFYYFLEHKLAFAPLQDLDSYGLGIALGGLEMDPLTLAHNLSLFPNNGIMKPLQLYYNKSQKDNYIRPPMSGLLAEKRIAESKYTELVTRVLNDRSTGVEQFGLRSNLNLSQDNYAVKTGTSRDYHDSWTVGYTPDFVVAVWIGNAENKPLKQVTGSAGAGRVWNEAMELLFNSKYNLKTPFVWKDTKELEVGRVLDIGLIDDVVSEHLNILEDKSLIITPHDGDTIELGPQTTIPLVSRREVEWYEGSHFLGQGTKIYFSPTKLGTYRISAEGEDGTEAITLRVVSK